MKKRYTIYPRLILAACLLCCASAARAQDDAGSADLPKIEYGLTARKYTIADISITGADAYEDFVLIGFSGLEVGEQIEVPGDKITSVVKKFWKQGLFSDVKVSATKIVGDSIWLDIALTQRPRISEINYNGLKKS